MDFVLSQEGFEIEPLPQRRQHRRSGERKNILSIAKPANAQQKSRPPKKRRKNPTHFLALRLPSQVLAHQGKEIQQAVLTSSTNPELLSHAVVDTRKLHLTLFVLHLQDQKAVENALSVLVDCAEDANIFDSEPQVELKGVGTFRRDVLFLQVEKVNGVPLLQKFQEAVFQRFIKAGIIEKDEGNGSAFKPHATLMKMSQASRKLRKKDQRKALRKLRLQVPNGFGAESEFGTHPLHYLELNEMRVAKDGYYMTAGKVPLSPAAVFLEEQVHAAIETVASMDLQG